MYFIWGPGYHPREETLGEGDFVCGPLLIINLGIRHLFWDWLTGQGAQKWLRAHGSARCPTNPITPGRGICQRREKTFILAGPSASCHRSMEGSFHLRKDPRAGGSRTEHGLWWYGGCCVPSPCPFIVLNFFQSTSHSLNWYNLFLCLLSVYSEECKLRRAGIGSE